MVAPYYIKELDGRDSKAMIALLLESRNVDTLKLSKDISSSFKHGKNYGLYDGSMMIGCAGTIDTPMVASLSYLYLKPQYRMNFVSLEFTYKVIESIEADTVYLKARDISTFRSVVEKDGSKYRFKKREFLERIMKRIDIDPMEV